MRKKMFSFKNIVMLFMAVGLLTSVGCRKQDDSSSKIDELTKEVSTLKADLLKDFQTKMNAEVEKLKAEISKLEKAGKDVEGKYVSLEMYNAFKNDVEKKIAKANTPADLTAIETSINSVDGRIAALEALLKIKDGNSEYDFASLVEKVKKNEDAIKELKEKGLDKEAFKKEFDALMKKMGVNIAELSGVITSLVLLPDYVSDNGGALPILNFSPLKTDACGDIVPAVEVRYVVNPSTATVDKIDTENLKFRYNDPIVLTGRPNTDGVDQRAEFVSLEGGILTVRATLNTEKLWSSKRNTENRLDQLMLEVPVKDSEVVVSSDWAKVVYKPQYVAIVKKPKAAHHAAEPWKSFELKDFVHQTPGNRVVSETVTLGVGVASPTMDYTVVDMEYNKDLNLLDHVQAMYKGTWGSVDLEKYGLHFEFDLINHETGRSIVYKLGPNNETDQQEFIKIKDGHFVTTKVFTLEGNRTAVGRTPIVHVMLVRGEGDNKCVARQGYIKLNIIEKEIPVVKPVKYVKAIDAGCATETVVYRVGTQEMNENFYHSVNMTKKEFHEKYTFTQTAYVANDPTNVGTIQQVVDPNVTESYNLVYTIGKDDVWKNVNRTAWAEGEYVYGNHKIKVRFEAPITKETVKLNIALDNYWYNGYRNIVHNVAVPDSGSTNSATCTWDSNNINSAFKTYNKAENMDNTVNTELPRKDKFNLLNLGYRQDTETMKRYNTYTYEYKFYRTQPSSPVRGIRLFVDATGKQLKASKNGTEEVVARILDQDGTALTGKGDILEYMENDLAKELLNAGPEAMKATVELIVYNNCGERVNVEVTNLPKKDKFDVHFLRPVNVSGKSAEDFVDAVDFGAKGSYIDVKSVASLSDWRNYIKNTDAYNFLPNNANFYSYYGVTSIKVDVDDIKVRGLKVNGTDVDRLPSTIEVKQTANDEPFDSKVYEYGRLTYRNNGATLNEPFTMYVPVTVTYKWGEVVATVVEIAVKPSSRTARKAAK